jgi:hypothetical protein
VSAFSRVFRPAPGDFGEMAHTDGVQIGTGGRALTATATVSVNIPKAFRKCQVINVAIVGQTAAAGSGAITAQLFRVVGGSSGTRTALTAAFDLTTGGISTLDKTFNVAITGTDTQCVIQPADTLTVDLVAAGTVTTAPQATLSVFKAIMK